jgi:hypothetical protein
MCDLTNRLEKASTVGGTLELIYDHSRTDLYKNDVHENRNETIKER